jgi:hypothetical protein
VTPVLDELSGIFPQEMDIEAYHAYLADKYGVN